MLPKSYAYLQADDMPKMIVEGVRLYGTLEVAGTKDNPVILAWAKEVSVDKAYNHDEIPWCGLYIAVVVLRAGKEVVKDPLWAANWLKFGKPTAVAMLGDVIVFKRPGGNHVGLYVGEDDTHYHILGGNQSDQVNITRIDKMRCIGIRRPMYAIQPPSVRIIKLLPSGQVSVNEK